MASRRSKSTCTKSVRWTPSSTSSARSKGSSSSVWSPSITCRSPWETAGSRRRTASYPSPLRPRRSCSRDWNWPGVVGCPSKVKPRRRPARHWCACCPPGHRRRAGLQQSGWGAGQRNPPHYPNALRLLLAEQAAEAGRVVLLATDVDDMSPEYVEPLRQALVSAGALDVQTWPVQMKKGRSGFRVEVMAPEELAEAVTAALFRHSTTAGVRRWVAERATLPRRQVTIQLSPDVAVRVKVLEQPDAGGVRVKSEYDDVLAAARALGRPALEIARAAERDAEALVAKSKE